MTPTREADTRREYLIDLSAPAAMKVGVDDGQCAAVVNHDG